MASENVGGGNENTALFVLQPILDTSALEGKFAETIKKLGKKSLTIDVTGDTGGLSKDVEKVMKEVARWEGKLQDSYAKIAENNSLINRLKVIPEGQRSADDISKLSGLTAEQKNLGKLNAAIEDIFKQMGLNIQTPERKKYNEEILPAYAKAKMDYEQGTLNEADFKLAEEAKNAGLQAAQEASGAILRGFREALSEAFKTGKIDLSTLLVPKVAKTRTQEILDDNLYGGWGSDEAVYRKAVMLRTHLNDLLSSPNLSENDLEIVDSTLGILSDYIKKYEDTDPKKRATDDGLIKLRDKFEDSRESLIGIKDDIKSEQKQDWEMQAEEALLETERSGLSNTPVARKLTGAIKNLRERQVAVEKLKYKNEIDFLSPEEQEEFQAAQQALVEAQGEVKQNTADINRVIWKRNRGRLKEKAEYKQTAKDFVEAAKDDDGQTEETQQAVQQEAEQAREEAAQHVEEASKEGAQEARQKILDALLDSNGEVKQPDGMTKEGRETFAEIQKALDENRDALSSDEQALIDKYKQEAENAIKPTRGRGAGVKNATARTATQKNIVDLAKLAKEKQGAAQAETAAPVTSQVTPAVQTTQATQAAEQKAEANEHVAQSAEQAAEAEKKMQEAVGNTAPVEQATAAAEQHAEANERAAEAANTQASAAKKGGSGSGNGGGSGGGGNPPSDDGNDNDNPADDLNRMMDNAKANVLKAIERANALINSLSKTSGTDSNLDGMVAELQHKVADAEARIERSDFDGDALSEDTLAAIMSDYDQLAELVERVQVRSKEISDSVKHSAESEAIYDREIAKDTKRTAQYNVRRTGLASNLRGGLNTLQSNLGKLDKFGVDTEAIRSQVQGALSSNQAMSLMNDTTEATKEKVEALAATWEVVNKVVQETTASIKQQEVATAAVDKAQTDIHAQLEKATTNVSNLQGLNTPSATNAANTYLDEISRAQKTLEEISAWEATPETKLKALNTVLESITDTAKNAGDAFKQLKKGAADAAKADDKLTKATTAAQKSLATIQDMRTQWTAMTASQRTELDAIETNLKEGLAGNDLEKLNAANQALVVFRANVKAAGKDTRSFFDASKAIASKLSSFFSMGQLVSTVVNRLKQAVAEVKKIDSSMVNLRKVAPGTDSSFTAYKKGAAARAIELSTSMTDYIDATTGFARMGESLGDAQKLGELAVIYKNVGDEISSVDDATNSLISTMKGFNKTTAEAESIVDAANYVGNNYAITSGAIGEVLKRSASSMAAANTSMEETIALGTAAQTVVQDEEKVGGALSTLAMRIRGSTSELESAGEEVDDYAASTSKLRDEIKSLTKVDIMKNATEYKSMYQILGEISKRWADLTDVSRANVAEILFGKMRANVGMSILSNFDIAENVLKDLTDGSADGSAMKEYETYLDSIEAKQQKMEAAFQSFSESLLDSSIVKFSYDTGSGILGLLTKLLDLLGSVPTAAGLAAVALKKAIPETGSKMPWRKRDLRWQKSVYAGNMIQGGLATAWSEKAGANAQRKHPGRGNKKTDQQVYGENLSTNRFLLYIANIMGQQGVDCTMGADHTLTDCKGLAA